MELPKTEQELADLIDARVQEATEKLASKHNGEMASTRKKYEDEISKLKVKAGADAEQLAQEKIKEQQEADQKELNELRAYKKSSEITQRLAKEGLPTYFKNDNRLLNAEEGDIDKVIKEVKKDYEATLPKGSTHSTVVRTTSDQPSVDSKTESYREAGEALKTALGG